MRVGESIREMKLERKARSDPLDFILNVMRSWL